MAKEFYPLCCLLFSFLNATPQSHDGAIAINSKSIYSITHSTKNIVGVNKNAGKLVSFCGKVLAARWEKGEANKPAALTLRGSYVNEQVEVFLRVDEAYNFNYDLHELFTGKNLCFNGIFLDEIDRNEIYLDSISAVRLVEVAMTTQHVADTNTVSGQKLILLNNAYLLAGPKWKAQVITHLKAGSIILAEKSYGGWTLATLVEKAGDRFWYQEGITGFISNQALGLNREGKLIVKK